MLKNIRRYKPNPEGKTPKFLNLVIAGVKYGEVRLFNVRALEESQHGDEVIVCEGELDCLVLLQNGLLAVTSTGGAGTFKPEWAKWFKGKRAVLVFDNDNAGKVASERVAELLHGNGVGVRIAKLPESVGAKGDVTDFFVAVGGNLTDFRETVLATAVEYEPLTFQNVDEEEPIEVTLPKASDLLTKSTLCNFRSRPRFGDREFSHIECNVRG